MNRVEHSIIFQSRVNSLCRPFFLGLLQHCNAQFRPTPHHTNSKLDLLWMKLPAHFKNINYYDL